MFMRMSVICASHMITNPRVWMIHGAGGKQFCLKSPKQTVVKVNIIESKDKE